MHCSRAAMLSLLHECASQPRKLGRCQLQLVENGHKVRIRGSMLPLPPVDKDTHAIEHAGTDSHGLARKVSCPAAARGALREECVFSV